MPLNKEDLIGLDDSSTGSSDDDDVIPESFDLDQEAMCAHREKCRQRLEEHNIKANRLQSLHSLREQSIQLISSHSGTITELSELIGAIESSINLVKDRPEVKTILKEIKTTIKKVVTESRDWHNRAALGYEEYSKYADTWAQQKREQATYVKDTDQHISFLERKKGEPT
jgi:hypothetical protein